MKKLNWPVIIVLALFMGAIALYLKSMSGPPKEKHTPPRTNITTTDSQQTPEIKVNDRIVIGKITEEQRKNPQTIKAPNKPSPTWEKELHKALESVSGETIQNIAVKKVASVIWVKNQGGMNAESVIITLKNKEGAESTFRALVDSATGRILETWDRTIFEPVGHKGHHEHSIIDYQPYYED
jgi:hypothetical protein